MFFYVVQSQETSSPCTLFYAFRIGRTRRIIDRLQIVCVLHGKIVFRLRFARITAQYVCFRFAVKDGHCLFRRGRYALNAFFRRIFHDGVSLCHDALLCRCCSFRNLYDCNFCCFVGFVSVSYHSPLEGHSFTPSKGRCNCTYP